MFKKIIIFTSLFIFILLHTSFANKSLSENAEMFIERYDKQSVQQEKINNTLITNIDKRPYFFPQNLKITALGDSLTKGVGDETDNSGYVGLIEDNLENEIDIDNFGISGYRSDQLLKLIKEPDTQNSLKEADLVLMTIGANDMMKVFKRDFSHLKVEPFFNELNDFKKRLTNIFKEIHAINSDAKIYLIGFYDPFSEYFPEIEELSYISSSWSTETNKVTDQFEYAYYIYTNPLFKGDVANYLSDDNFHPNNKGYTKIANEALRHISKEVDDFYDTK